MFVVEVGGQTCSLEGAAEAGQVEFSTPYIAVLDQERIQKGGGRCVDMHV
jgi:hypothetical protein